MPTPYERKRNFTRTPEPKKRTRRIPASKRYPRSGKPLIFVVQKHRATHLHYDLRIEVHGVLKSWALPKGPSMNPKERRLAIQVEDHPFEYKDFEGVIPPGNYGAGEVIVWDAGTYTPLEQAINREAAIMHGLYRGSLRLVFNGRKLRGAFSLIRFRPPDQWLFTKMNDRFASDTNVTEDDHSVLSARTLHDE